MMKSSGDKGQVALEKVVLYSLVVLVTLVGLIALWRIGAFDSLIGRRGSVGFSQVVIGDWVFSTTNMVYLELINEADSDVRINPYGITANTEYINCTAGPMGDLIIQAGRKFIIPLTCPDISPIYKTGDFYSLDVSVNYTNLLTSRSHLSIGKLYGITEYSIGGLNPTTTTISEDPCSCRQVICSTPGEFAVEECTLPACNYGPGYPEELECEFCHHTTVEGDLFPNDWCWPKYYCGITCGTDVDCSYNGPWPPG
jgi:hypothetical protein